MSITEPSPDRHPLVQVAVPAPLRTLFDYSIPDSIEVEKCLPGQRVAVPFGRRELIGVIVSQGNAEAPLASSIRPLIAVLEQSPSLPQDILQLALWAARYYQHPVGEVLLQTLPVRLRQRRDDWFAPPECWQATQTGRLLDLATLARAPRQQDALRWLQQHPEGLHPPMLKALGVPRQQLQALAEKGFATCSHDTYPHPSQPSALLRETALPLTPEQDTALQAISQHQGFGVFLLDGVTGSGKTEVYLQAIEATLRANRQVLVLIPEISLSPQTVKRFKQRFNVPISVLHSRLNDSERLENWVQARIDCARIVIGTRSALFTPLSELGLIVVDEEHDLSFKQQDGFRFHARDVAIVRARDADVPIVLGSATPSLESLHNAHSGRYQWLRLQQRPGDTRLPTTRIINVREIPLEAGLSPTLIAALKSRLERAEQVLIFLNRRGFSPVLMCHDCGWMLDCPHCDHHLTLHQAQRRMQCHHCGHHQRVPPFCKDCHSSDLRPVGTGTERLHEFLQQQLPAYPIIRIDRDTTQRKQALAEQLKRVHQGTPCVLVGTQMLAKGHHFPNVTLVAICDLDAGLFAADFRATEHTAQLITQVSGRAGRAEKPGEVWLQTHHPEHPLMDMAVAGDYSQYAQQLLQERQLMQLPPFNHVALLRAESNDESVAIRTLQHCAEVLQTGAEMRSVEVWGPAPALMARRGGRYRQQLLLKSATRASLQRVVQAGIRWLEQNTTRHVRWSVDIDPVSLD